MPLQDIERPHGPIDNLLGLNEAALHPITTRDKIGNRRLLESRFGPGLLVGSRHLPAGSQVGEGQGKSCEGKS